MIDVGLFGSGNSAGAYGEFVMIVSLPGVTSCQLVCVEADGQLEPAVLDPPPVVVPQPASVSSASDAAMKAPTPVRSMRVECEGVECVGRESMSRYPLQVTPETETQRRPPFRRSLHRGTSCGVSVSRLGKDGAKQIRRTLCVRAKMDPLCHSAFGAKGLPAIPPRSSYQTTSHKARISQQGKDDRDSRSCSAACDRQDKARSLACRSSTREERQRAPGQGR